MDLKSPAGHNLRLRLKASLLGVVGSFVFFAAYLAVPPLGIFSGILAPFPAAYNRLLHGRMSSLIVLFGTATAITLVFGVFGGSLYLGLCAMIGLLMPELLLRGVSGSRSVYWTTVANLLIFFGAFMAYSAVSGVDLQALIATEISGSLKQAVALYEKGGVTGEELELIRRSMSVAADMLQRLYPALVTTLLIIIAAANLALIKKTLVKNVSLEAIGDFSTFKNPDLLVWVFIASGFSLLLPDSRVTTPALNLMLVITILYLFQGMAIIASMINKYSVPAFVRVLLYAMLIIQPYLLTLVAGIGLFDLWADFRAPKAEENL